jgi:Ran GTPase-activating protein (RanGAP) involved in mRNA processing and transport
LVQDGQSNENFRLREMNLEGFLQRVPRELGEHVVPATRALLLRRVSKTMRGVVDKLRCRVDVGPGALVRRMYAGGQQAAVRLFVGRSLQLSMSDFDIRSFTLHGMVLKQTGSFNAMLRRSTRLEVLDMHNNHIPEDSMHEVFAALPASLRVLRLARQWITRAAVTPLCAALSRLVLLQELDLSENYVNSHGMEALSACVTSTRLARLSLGHNALKSRFWNEHPSIGIDRFVLEKLDVSHNKLQANFCDSIYACVRGSAAVLVELDVSFNDMRITGVSYMSTALQKCQALRHLNIAGNRCGDSAIALLLAVIHPRVPGEPGIALESLDVAHNNLTAASARLFSRCVAGSPALRRSLSSVSFSHNDLRDTGGMLVIEALLPCRMTSFGLAGCMISEAAGLCLAGTMLLWQTLARLDVSGNCLGSASLLLMARALSENESKHKYMVFIGNWEQHESTQEVLTILAGAPASRE